jgi:hypothetical protein
MGFLEKKKDIKKADVLIHYICIYFNIVYLFYIFYLFSYGLTDHSVSSSDYIVSSDRIIMINTLKPSGNYMYHLF